MPSKVSNLLDTWDETDRRFVDDGGIVSIEDPERYQLPASYTNRNDSNAGVYSISMFHQLHCLVSLLLVLLRNRSLTTGELHPDTARDTGRLHRWYRRGHSSKGCFCPRVAC
jgi:hypothetical protein